MYGNGRAGRSVVVEKSTVHFIVAFEVLHIHQESRYVYHISQACPGTFQQGINVFEHSFGLFPDVQVPMAACILLGAGMGVIGPSAARSGNEDEVPYPFHVGVIAQWLSFIAENFAFDGHI